MTTGPLSRNQKGFIKKKWNTMTIPEIADSLDVSEQQVKEWLQYNDLIETKSVHEARKRAAAPPENEDVKMFQHDPYYKFT
jgi:uncharacterized protein YjcR